MFSPDEVKNWPKAVQDNPDLKRNFCGKHLGSVVPKFGPITDTHRRVKADAGLLKAPANIYGVPYDRACLQDISTYPIHYLPTESKTIRNVRVIGKSALLDDQDCIYSPRASTSMTKEEFLDIDSYGHQGFLKDESKPELRVYFSQRVSPRAYDADAIFLNDIEAGNFGSFMFRQLPQLTHLKSNPVHFDCYIAERTNFLMEAIDLLGLPDKPVLSLREVAGDPFRTITFYDMDDAEGFLSPIYRTELRKLVDTVLADRGSLKVSHNLYVSRWLSTLRLPWYRVMSNESNVEAIARSRGLEVVYPETWSLRNQIRIFCRASRVIGPSGSGMFNLAFSESPERVVDIETYHVTVRQHAKLYSSCGAEYSFLFSPFSESHVSDPTIAQSTCDEALLHEALDWLLA